jgi:molybdopterin/thiamine biosynthesis adenylyltransferase
MTPAAGAAFSYAEMTTRNAGFLSAAEQAALRASPIFVVGVGGMGGAAVQALVRAGAERLVLADFDRFDVSNLNRQVFSGVSTVGREKVEATVERLADINPALRLTTYGREWTDALDTILGECHIVVNGMDDLAAGLHLYRRARALGATVIDAYTSPLPSVTVVRPADPRPEERLGFPTRDIDWRALTPAQADACKLAEGVYVMTHSSSADHIDLAVAGEMLAGTRSRPSFAPMVITTGNLMAFEAVSLAVGRRSGVDHRGAFFNPWTFRVERPRAWPVAAARRVVVRRVIRALAAGPGPSGAR